jgi:uncharacterized protein YwgA
MTPRDWLLLYFALKGAPSGLDPVRIQKGMFLLAMEGGLSAEETYDFAPYHYGPMSSTVYADLDALEAEGLIEGEEVSGYTWKRFRVTPAGLEAARELKHETDTAALRRLYDIKQKVSEQTFAALLRDVYAKYPEYASRSVFQG